MAKIVRFQRSGAAVYPVEVQDEARYRENLAYLLERSEGAPQDLTARLILEEDKEIDTSAVRVEIEGQTVGHLSEAEAKLYRAKLVSLCLSEVIGTCAAHIRLEPREKEGTTTKYAVRLDIDLANLAIADEEVAEQILTPEPVVDPPRQKYSRTQILAVLAGVVFTCGCLGCAGGVSFELVADELSRSSSHRHLF
ncbi:MAG TPA: hypothetical protein PK530_05270 [Anaerolineales bacterium]|nr:hypothetical protein [Anaerolineales bacterium]